jgi:hypothetical protein
MQDCENPWRHFATFYPNPLSFRSPGRGPPSFYHEYHRRVLLVLIHFNGLCSIKKDGPNEESIDWKFDTEYEVVSGVGVWIGPGATSIGAELLQ